MGLTIATLNAIAPVVLCLLLGKILTYTPMFRGIEWAVLEKIMFWVFLPPLIFSSIVGGDFDVSASLKLAGVFVVAQGFTALVAYVHARTAHLSAAAMTSLFQNAVRWNNIIPIALVATLYGDSGLNLVAIALVVMVPIANVSCIVVIEYALPYETTMSAWAKLAAVFKNPLIVACIAGLAVKVSGIALPAMVANTLDILGAATLGTGLLVVGASLSFGAMRRARAHVMFGAVLKIIAMPLFTLALTVVVGIDGLARVIAVLCTAAPTAMQGYIVARNMGGDAELMSSLIVTEHLAVGVTIPLLLLLAMVI